MFLNYGILESRGTLTVRYLGARSQERGEAALEELKAPRSLG